MSNTLTRAARPLPMPSIEKAVLMALADMARDPGDPEAPGQAWPPMLGQGGTVGLCDWTCLSERSVQRAIKGLLAAGHISRRQLRHGALYTVHPVGGASSPVTQSGDRESGACVSPSPVTRAPKASLSTIAQKAPPSSLARAAPQGTRLSDAFVPPAKWLAWAMDERRWTRAEAERVATDFRDYWIAKPGKDGRKLDWSATWRRWVRNTRGYQHGNGRGSHGSAQGGGRGGAADAYLAAFHSVDPTG